MRLGLHALEEGWVIIQKLTPYPIDFLCIHPRLGIQHYEDSVNLDAFELMYQNIHHQMVYSGDINDVDFFEHLQKRFPKIDHWMLGRGILQNPFLAEQILNAAAGTKNALPLQQQQQRFSDFYAEYSEILLALKSEKIALSALKELWHYFAVFWKLDAIQLRELLRVSDYQQFNNAVKIIFSQGNF